MNDIIAEKLKLLPDEPGVYKMYDGSGEIIYVGKAVNLKTGCGSIFSIPRSLPRWRPWFPISRIFSIS